jgi:hypothetical protein
MLRDAAAMFRVTDKSLESFQALVCDAAAMFRVTDKSLERFQ